MTNERLEQLKQRVAKADETAGEIEALRGAEYEQEFGRLSYPIRCELYRLGRQALLAKKEAELESLLTEQKPVEILNEISKSATVSFVAQPDALDCCEGASRP